MSADSLLIAAMLAALAEEEPTTVTRQLLDVMRVGGVSVTPEPPVAVAPLYSSAEIGTVNAYTVVATFDQNITASNYATGVTIKVNTVSQTITSATRQANHAIVHYVIPVLWHGSGDTVTWEYTGGNIVAEDDATALANVSAQAVTNNVTWEALLDLQADTLALADNDPVSTWADQTIYAHDFTQTGSARPIKSTIGGYSAVVSDFDDEMIGGSFADNLNGFTVIAGVNEPCNGILIGKLKIDFTDGLWFCDLSTRLINLQTDGDNYMYRDNLFEISDWTVITYEMIDRTNLHVYKNGDNSAESALGTGGIMGSYSNLEPVTLFSHPSEQLTQSRTRFVLLYFPAPPAADRAALEIRLGARYGITI